MDSYYLQKYKKYKNKYLGIKNNQSGRGDKYVLTPEMLHSCLMNLRTNIFYCINNKIEVPYGLYVDLISEISEEYYDNLFYIIDSKGNEKPVRFKLFLDVDVSGGDTKKKVDSIVKKIMNCNLSEFKIISYVNDPELTHIWIAFEISPNPAVFFEKSFNFHFIKNRHELNDYFVEAHSKAEKTFLRDPYCLQQTRLMGRQTFRQQCTYSPDKVNERLHWGLYFPNNTYNFLFGTGGGGSEPYEISLVTTLNEPRTTLYCATNYGSILLERGTIRNMRKLLYTDFYMPVFYLSFDFKNNPSADFGVIKVIESTGDFKVVLVKYMYNQEKIIKIFYFYIYLKKNEYIDNTLMFESGIRQNMDVQLPDNLMQQIAAMNDSYKIRVPIE